jgi:hypothetical protein
VQRQTRGEEDRSWRPEEEEEDEAGRLEADVYPVESSSYP